ncbi:MAG TPA: ATP-binding protein [Anaerolineales bacterium]|nr:ATP-binding protein [Anaerolineales bacterium]
MKSKSRILIIDDEEVVLDSCSQILEGGNYEIATSLDGTSGLKLAGKFKPDLAFVDLKMPGLSGFDVLEKLHDIDPTIVTIVITGYATINSAVEAMKKGAYDFLPKPFTPDEFRIITQRGLEKRSLILETIALRREKEMLREHFAAIVSHELKAPLTAVQQNLFVLIEDLSGQLKDHQLEGLERMKSRIDNLMKLISTWLRVISADIGIIRDNFKPTSITSTISKAIENVQTHATRKDVEILTSIQDPALLVMGDEGTLVEALMNLLDNAIKYSRAGSQVSLEVDQDEGDILISVIDTGVGISKEDLPFIFDDFYAGRFVKEAGRGSGLGLAITRRIIVAHQGAISVESELSKGSKFTIRIPAFKSDSPNNFPHGNEVLAKSET